jgi:hypothetical protein
MSRENLLLLSLACILGLTQIAAGWFGPYGLFHDELYYWACAKRPGFGYVDHPPFSGWVLAAGMRSLGEGLLVFEMVPAICAAGTVALTGLMARRLGAGIFGQCAAAVAAMTAPFNLVLFSFYSVNAIEILLWTATVFLMVELIRTGDERLWLAIGAVAGIGLLNKHTYALLAFGLGVGVLATRMRVHVRHRWLWGGMALALLLALPNFAWNYAYDWPSLAFYRSRPTVDLPASVGEALVLQILGTNPVAVLLWLPGTLYLLLSRRMRPYRPLGICFLVLFVVILSSGQRRGDRIAGIYPLVLAAGGCLWDRWRSGWYRVARVALIVLLLGFGAIAIPAALPVFPPATVGRYLEAIGQKPEIERHDVDQAIPLYLRGRLEWERFANEVISVWSEGLSAEERGRSVIIAPHWVYAAVIEYYARDRDHPPVAAPHNAYWFWREEAAGRDIAVSVMTDPEALGRYFGTTRQIGVFHCARCPLFRRDVPVYVSTQPVRPVVELLDEWRHFGIDAAPLLRGPGTEERGKR